MTGPHFHQREHNARQRIVSAAAGMPQAASRRLVTLEGLAPMTLCALVALVPLAFAAPLFEPYLAIKEILVQAGAATVAALWLLTARVGPLTLVFTPVWIPLVGLALASGLSVLWSSHPFASLEEGQRLVTYVLLFAVALHQMGRTEIRATLATTVILAGAIEAVYVLLQYSLGDPIFVTDGLPGKWRTFGTLGNPNWTGEFLTVAAIVSLGRLVHLSEAEPSAFNMKRRSSWSMSRERGQSARRWMLVTSILIWLALAATLARGAWLGCLVGVGAFLVARHRYADSRREPATVVQPQQRIWPLALTIGIGAALIALPLLSNQEAVNHLLNFKSVRGRLWM
ncbi:MAG: hypothetical protein HY314_09710 [Acidobacteria bacterium]|nr:hypothetical protein [Acidobacteriota bacterium]